MKSEVFLLSIKVYPSFVVFFIAGILQFIGLSLTFYYYNVTVKREVANQTPRTVAAFFVFGCQLAVAIAALAYIIWSDMLFHLWYVKEFTKKLKSIRTVHLSMALSSLLATVRYKYL